MANRSRRQPATDTVIDAPRVQDGETVERVAAQLLLASADEARAVVDLPPEPKRRRGRPPGSGGRNRKPAEPVPSPADVQRQMEEQARAIAPVIYGMVIMFRPAYTEEQAVQLTLAALPVAEKYGEHGIFEWLPEIVLAGVILSQFVIPIMRERQEREQGLKRDNSSIPAADITTAGQT